jgi:diacylglycerol kinase family enzyme
VQNRLASPRFAFLTLGTGNGLRRVVGASDPLADLRRLVEDGAGRTHSVPVIESNGERFLFAGLGYDSMLLNDYNWLRTRVHGRIARPLVQTVLGYFGALFSRTLPRVLLKGHQLNVRVTALGESYYVDPRRGDAAMPVTSGASLYEGPASMLGVGTTPFFGYGLKIFPFAGMMPNMMHLRVCNTGPLTTLAHLPAVWRGTYRNSEDLHDFLVSEVRIELDQPFPFQHSGDDQGLASHLHFKIAEERLKLVDFYSPKLPA